MHKNGIYDTVAREAQGLIPSDFYDVRQEVTPKAGWGIMYGLAAVAYAACIIVFALVYTTESRKSYTETIIASHDKSGVDGYSCQMLSKVSASYQLSSPSGEDPVLAYDLANVIESKAQYQVDTAAADPCNSELAYFPGEISSIFGSGVYLKGAAMYGTQQAMVLKTTGYMSPQSVLFLNYLTGVLTTWDISSSTVPFTLVATASGAAAYLEQQGDICYLRTMTVAGVQGTLGSVPCPMSESNPKMVSDTAYNLYIASGSTLYAADVTTTPGQVTLDPLLAIGKVYYVDSLAVYWDEDAGRANVYYVYLNQSVPQSNPKLFLWNSAMTQPEQLPTLSTPYLVTVDTNNHYYHLENDGPNSWALLNSANENVGQAASNGAPSAMAIKPDGSRIFFASSTEVQDQMQFLYGPGQVQAGQSNRAQYIEVVSGFGAGYFQCGSAVLAPGDYTPGEVEEYPYACDANGVVGQVRFIQSYAFTETDAIAYATDQAAPQCPNLYAPIGETISDLPPYQCSRSERPSFLACLATAVANTQLLFQVLVFLSAALLSRLARRFPPQHVKEQQKPGASAPEVEMSGRFNDVENPMPRA